MPGGDDVKESITAGNSALGTPSPRAAPGRVLLPCPELVVGLGCFMSGGKLQLNNLRGGRRIAAAISPRRSCRQQEAEPRFRPRHPPRPKPGILPGSCPRDQSSLARRVAGRQPTSASPAPREWGKEVVGYGSPARRTHGTLPSLPHLSSVWLPLPRTPMATPLCATRPAT